MDGLKYQTTRCFVSALEVMTSVTLAIAKLVGFTPTYYLEHDCDWLTFLKAANFKEYEIEINEIDDGLDSPIRSYSNIQGK
jgi:hypothetical protein